MNMPHVMRLRIQAARDFFEAEIDMRQSAGDQYLAAASDASGVFEDLIRERDALIRQLVDVETWLSTADGSKPMRLRIRRTVEEISGKGWDNAL